MMPTRYYWMFGLLIAIVVLQYVTLNRIGTAE
jgi:hypothetical protein